MMFSSSLPLAAAAALTALFFTPTAHAAPLTAPAVEIEARQGSGFPSASGTQFQIGGQTGYFAGADAYWMSFLETQSDVDSSMATLQQAGIKIVRVWGFNIVNTTQSDSDIYFQTLIPGQAPGINTGPNGLQRLDAVVQSAEAHDMVVIINFNNNWGDFGGVPMYWNYFGVTQEAWFSDPKSQATYQSYIQAVVSRYSNSSAIFAWELMNEPRCPNCPLTTITNWATSTAQYIKSIDPGHMVTLGDEGFNPGGGDGSFPYQSTEGIDWAANLAIPDIDFGTMHLYPAQWNVASTGWPEQYIAAHATVCVKQNKPCFLEEYGDNADASILAPWQNASLSTAGMAGDAFWQFGDPISNGPGTTDGNAISPNTAQWTTLVTDHVQAIQAKNGFS